MEIRFAIVAVLIFLLSSLPPDFVSAQKSAAPAPFALMKDLLNLTDVQVTEIESIFDQAEQACITEAGSQNIVPCLKARRDSIEAAIDRVLTASQLETLKAIQQQRDTYAQGLDNYLTILTQALGLSAAQQAEIQAVLANAQVQCAGELSQDDRQACLSAQRAQVDTAVKNILTADQSMSFEALQNEQRGFSRPGSLQNSLNAAGASASASAGRP